MLLAALGLACKIAGCTGANQVGDSSAQLNDGAVMDVPMTDIAAINDAVERSDTAQQEAGAVVSDGWVSTDGGHFECARAADCDGRIPEDDPFPGGLRWSCIAGRCTYELEGRRTCDYSAQLGCLRCLGIPEEYCPGAPCIGGAMFPQLRVERPSRCGLTADVMGSVVACYNGMVRLRDGSFCTILEAPTGAIRFVLSCGGCAVTLVP